MAEKTLLIIGSGGREHALAWKLAQSKEIKKIFIAPGNAGSSQEQNCENVNLHTIEELVNFAKSQQIDLTIVGPEALLVEGIADEFTKQGLSIFAPNKISAQLEGSKSFAKQFMEKYGVKTAKFNHFKDKLHAIEYLNMIQFPIVVKASGLAAGKGVVICQNLEEAKQAINEIMVDQVFGSAGAELVIEEFLEGFEVSILSICDGKNIVPFISAKDHKKIGEGETGLNTGGMGVVAPNPLWTDEHNQEFIEHILNPTLNGIQQEEMDFLGVIFFGLMVTDQGVFLLEYNVRFGDPETQAVLPLLESDLYDILTQALHQTLDQATIQWKDESSCCVVAVSAGYPKKYEKNKVIHIDQALSHSKLFIAGAIDKNGEMITSGGRVLNVVSTSKNLDGAKEQVYQDITKINFDGMNYRTDIGMI